MCGGEEKDRIKMVIGEPNWITNKSQGHAERNGKK